MTTSEPRSSTVPSGRFAPELLIVLACVVMLVLVSLPAMFGLQLSLAIIAVSFAIGLVAGIGYHVALWKALAPVRPRLWWWSPTHMHARLDRAQRRRVIPWFVVGASGFCGSMLGATAFLSAALRL
ncbi:MAG: hypothetical protein IAG13_24550 [Deltaproteobacteria bacterium]|nr:hypothetical protein [Nannocystaceae bacterium]